MTNKWTEKEVKFLKDNYGKQRVSELSRLLNKTKNSIYKKAKRCNLSLSVNEKKKIFSSMAKEYLHKNSQKEDKNYNWKGGISKNNYNYKKIQKERFPKKVKARESVFRAVKNGKLIKQPCFICGSQIDIEAHHFDYNKPLSVIWLCKEHHRWIHKANPCHCHQIIYGSVTE